MKVELIAFSQPYNKFVPNMGLKNPSEIAERCASVCYNSKPTNSFTIMKTCIKEGHKSIAEHISFTFHISEVSRALLAQLSRHRHISLSVRSTRYCNEKNFETVDPIFYDEESYGIYNNIIENINDCYNKLSNVESKEKARMILPLSLCTELYMTANARTLIEISNLRLCTRAELEIRTLFHKIKECIEDVCPEVAQYMVPNCEKYEISFCTENKSCGKYPKLKSLLDENVSYNGWKVKFDKEVKNEKDCTN